MTKPREKTCEELTAEIEDGKKKIRQFENREKMLRQKLSVEERKARNHRLCKRGGFMESLVPELIAMLHGEPCAGADCHAGRGRESLFTACLDERASTGVLEKTSREREREIIPLEQRARNNPFGTKGALIHPCGRVRSAESLSPHTEFSPRSDMAALPQQGAAPLAPLTRLSLHTHKNSTPAPASVLFLRVLLSYPGGDTHSHLPL